MKRLLIVTVAIVCLVGAAASGVYARRIPVRPSGDADEVQCAKRHEELAEPQEGSGPTSFQGQLTPRRSSRAGGPRPRRLHIQVRFPGREFFLEK
jgi:hypothetical protein